MEIQTKFNIGDEVAAIRKERYTTYSDCTLCDGKGRAILANDESRTAQCPECYGRGRVEAPWKERWTPHEFGLSPIGSICVRVGHNAEEYYMIEATGVGSGTCWNPQDLYANLEDAQAACDALNEALASKVSHDP